MAARRYHHTGWQSRRLGGSGDRLGPPSHRRGRAPARLTPSSERGPARGSVDAVALGWERQEPREERFGLAALAVDEPGTEIDVPPGQQQVAVAQVNQDGPGFKERLGQGAHLFVGRWLHDGDAVDV